MHTFIHLYCPYMCISSCACYPFFIKVICGAWALPNSIFKVPTKFDQMFCYIWYHLKSTSPLATIAWALDTLQPTIPLKPIIYHPFIFYAQCLLMGPAFPLPKSHWNGKHYIPNGIVKFITWEYVSNVAILIKLPKQIQLALCLQVQPNGIQMFQELY